MRWHLRAGVCCARRQQPKREKYGKGEVQWKGRAQVWGSSPAGGLPVQRAQQRLFCRASTTSPQQRLRPPEPVVASVRGGDARPVPARSVLATREVAW